MAGHVRGKHRGRGLPRTPRSKTRVVVDGVNHPHGKPIRFKSQARADAHIANMRGRPMTPNPARRKGKKRARRSR